MTANLKAEAGLWFNQGDLDFNAARVLLDSGGPNEAACFHCHQWTEKYLKGFLLWHGQRPARTHRLDFLLNLCAKVDSDFSKFSDQAIVLTNCYTGSRYPMETEFVYKADEILAIADSIVHLIKRKLNLD